MITSECYCINLLERNDRLDEVKKVFEKYDIPIIYHRVRRHPEGGKKGCFTSHTDIIKEAHRKNLDHVIIFEDDIICNLSKEEFNEKMKQVYHFINNNNYDIFFLGSIPEIFNFRTTKVSSNIYKAHAYCTHAYILSRTGIKKYCNMLFSKVPIDFVYLNSDNAYAMYPSIFYQNESKSDVAPSWVDFHGFKNRLVKLRENYATNVNIQIGPLLVAIVVLCIIAFFFTFKWIFLIFPILYFSVFLFAY